MADHENLNTPSGVENPITSKTSQKEVQQSCTPAQIVGKTQGTNPTKSMTKENRKFINKKYQNELELLSGREKRDIFYKVTAKDRTNLSTIDTIKAYEDIKRHIRGNPTKIIERRDGALSIIVNNEEQANLLKTQENRQYRNYMR